MTLNSANIKNSQSECMKTSDIKPTTKRDMNYSLLCIKATPPSN